MPGKCVFNESWITHSAYKNWIVKDRSSIHKARCKLCQKSFDISNMGESGLKSHLSGKKHKELEALTAKSPGISQFISASNTTATSPSGLSAPSTSALNPPAPRTCDPVKDSLISSYLAKEETLKAEIRWTLHTVEKHHSFHSNEGIEKVFQDMFSDSPTAMKFSCGEKKCSYLACFGLAPYFVKLLKEKVNKEDGYVLLFDESLNAITKNKQLDVFVRFWDCGRVATRYWVSQFVGHATADDLLEHINKSTESLCLQKLIQVCIIFIKCFNPRKL